MIESIDFQATVLPSGHRPKGIFITDFDGTLKSSFGTIAERDLDTLRELGSLGYLRVIATGRSMYSLYKVIDPSLPVDYIIFSSGAGIMDFQNQSIIRKANLESDEVKGAARFFIDGGYDIMIHLPIPDNHRFLFFSSGKENSDFTKRCELYRDFCEPFDGSTEFLGPGAQILIIEPPGPLSSLIESFERDLPYCSVIRTTSPLDGSSHWIEIFPKGISKGQTTAWLANNWGLGAEHALAVGNDYNDLDLLRWSKTSYVVANAPEELRRDFSQVSSNNRCGVTEAVRKWLSIGVPGPAP
jgi:hydroxymethylpyrimidine pyrophosphatase-like HAD family hydrolase